MKENQNEEQEKKFDQINPKRKRMLANYCLMSIIQYKNRTDSQLRVNQENIKKKLCIDYANKSGELKSMQQELEFIDLVCKEIITNRKTYTNLKPSERKGELYRKLKELGATDIVEDLLSPLDEIINEVMGYELNQKDLRPKTKDDFNKLYRPDLLHGNSTTGKKELHYGRYSEGRVMPQVHEYKGRKIELKKVGKMSYLTAFGLEDYLDEYLVTTPEGSEHVFLYDFSLDRIENDEEYRKVFFDELLSQENLTTYNLNGYIGEIVDIEGIPGNYKVDYVPERYTAVAELKSRLKEMQQQKNKETKHKKEDLDK